MPQDRKRRKISLLGTFAEYQTHREEQKHKESAALSGESAFADHKHSEAVPNVIGNEGDEVLSQNEASQVPSARIGDETQQQQQEGDVVMYKDVTGQTMRTRRTKSKTRL